jgi:CubicO group peptidase (beta-lactamase class C family)
MTRRHDSGGECSISTPTSIGLAAMISIVAALAAGCSGDSGSGARAWPTNGWTVEAPAAHGMDAAVLEGARDYAFQPQKHTQGVVVVRHGVIVADWYEEGRDETSFATSWSVAKSFASAAVGIAIDEGLIAGVDVSMAEFFPDWRGTEKEAITLRDVLQMATGLEWVESYDPGDLSSSNIIQMILAERDQLAYAAAQPLALPPGTSFSYSSGDTMLLSGVLEVATGRKAGEYAAEKLFRPIGMAPVDWWRDAEGHTATYCCVDTPSREFAKLGLLYLRGGEWDGVQVVSSEWVAASTSPSPSYAGYGYQWWLDAAESGLPAYYSARGHDGQYIYVVPTLDLVVVRNGHYDKYPGEPMANPSLWPLIPSDGLIEGAGTIAPDDGWSDAAFLGPIVASIEPPSS